MLDPLDVFLKARTSDRGMVPVPLISTDYEIEIVAGLAVVTCHRLFRNAEASAIEAVMTFPVPLRATLFSLTANIDGRTLKASAQESWRARSIYEAAVERGKSAVLHEEPLRGIHTLSVANLGSGSQIKLSTSWAMPLLQAGQKASLRIPQSVGDVYGRSPLPDAGALATGAPAQPVLVAVRSDTPFDIPGAKAGAARFTLTSALPIEITCDSWEPRALNGVTGRGRKVQLTLLPSQAGSGAVDVAVLLDRSDSMADPVYPGSRRTSHQMARAGLHALVDLVEPQDRLELWEFSDRPQRVGVRLEEGERAWSDRRAAMHAQLLEFSPPGGGTEIGQAIDAVLNASDVRDILLVTDGQSNALDVGRLAARGRRISVVLIGAGSLEARIGHLAALTGGNVFIATASNVNDVLAAAYHGLRSAYVASTYLSEIPEQFACSRDGVRMHATWSDDEATASPDSVARAIAAVAAAMLLPSLPEGLAIELALAEGLVSHVTSLVMVDEEGETFAGKPAMRKVDLAGLHEGRKVSVPDLSGLIGASLRETSELHWEEKPGPHVTDHDPRADVSANSDTVRAISDAIARLSRSNQEAHDPATEPSPVAPRDWPAEWGDAKQVAPAGEVQVAGEALHARLEVYTTLFVQASHELRTPLNAIIGFAEMIRSGAHGPLPKWYQEYAALIHEGGRRLALIVDDIIDLARVGTDRYPFTPESVSLADLADEAVRFMASEAARKRIDLVRGGAQGAEVFADSRAVRQIALNLISNALKFAPTDGKIVVTAEEVEGGAVLSVTDTGCGFSLAELESPPRVFEHGSAGQKHKGAGLGLSVVSALAKLHGGGLDIRNTSSGGARVAVFFPAENAALQVSVQPRPLDGPTGAMGESSSAPFGTFSFGLDWLVSTARKIDWERCGAALGANDEFILPAEAHSIIAVLGSRAAIQTLAGETSLSVYSLSLAFLASLIAEEDAAAARHAAHVLGNLPPVAAVRLGSLVAEALQSKGSSNLPA